MLEVKVRVGKKRVLVIPKNIAEEVGIREGSIVKLSVQGKNVVIEPEYDAIWLSLRGEKVAKISLKDLEETSLEEQSKHIT
ncbi:MAG: hypothetical protein DRJ33_02225 [Candidatus Methanomethylicota archaeon]|uniref:SpoVT-AbrB domain-containing protein n=1 Tax=Thermoproteota archaeon TaxID=2056631 RepID=A0A497F009_9CREN|nr:MAG: hypothetical protein DRJ33_02225 [Candidatus Verstraetearchaeota archaeon]